MAKKSTPPEPPNFEPLARAARQQSERSFQLSQDQMEWAKAQYADDKEITSKVISAALDRQTKLQGYAEADRSRYEDVFQPVEDRQVREAMNADTPEKIAANMGTAQSSVNQNFEAQRAAALKNLEGFGVDPSSTRYAALDSQVRAQQAAAQAGAANAAREATVNRGSTLRQQAIGVGQGYDAKVAGNMAMATQAGNTGASTALAQTGSGGTTMGTGNQWAANASGGIRDAGAILTSGYDSQMKGYEAQQNASSGWGSALGTAAGFFLEDGGAVPAMPTQAIPTAAAPPSGATPGGAIPTQASASGGRTVDDVDAKLTAGEFVIPTDVTSWKGEEFFQKLIEQSRKAKPQAVAQPEYAVAQRGPTTFASRPDRALPIG